MADNSQLDLLKQGVKVWNAWRRRQGDGEEINLSGADLSGADLRKAELNGADLSGADLRKAKLNGAELNGAKLNGAKLRKAKLREASLFRAKLRKAKLRKAKLSDADLTGADLTGADLSDADLSDAVLTEANLSDADLSDANLLSANLLRAKLSRANLLRAKLTDADLFGASLRGAKLTDADLNDANLLGAVLIDADLTGADLSEAVLGGADLRKAKLNGADLTDANLHGAILNNAELIGADLTEANLSEANLHGADLRGSKLSRTQALYASFSKATFSGACIADWHIGSSTKLDDIACDHIFRTIDQNGKFSGRLPVDENSFFAKGEFTQRFQILASALETIDITFTEGIDWQAFFQSFQEVYSNRPTEELSIQGMERKGEAFVVRLETNADTDQAAIETEVRQLYAVRLAALETQYAEKLKLQGVQIEDARQAVTVARKRETSLLEIMTIMAENKSSKYEFHAPVANVVDTAQANSRVQSIQHNYPSEQRQNLADAAREIKALLEHLSESYLLKEIPSQAVEQIKRNPQMKERVMGALKSSGKTALEKLVDHPAASIALAAIEGAINPKGTK